MYRTGDPAGTPDGSIEYLGRQDSVKIRGRVELRDRGAPDGVRACARPACWRARTCRGSSAWWRTSRRWIRLRRSTSTRCAGSSRPSCPTTWCRWATCSSTRCRIRPTASSTARRCPGPGAGARRGRVRTRRRARRWRPRCAGSSPTCSTSRTSAATTASSNWAEPRCSRSACWRPRAARAWATCRRPRFSGRRPRRCWPRRSRAGRKTRWRRAWPAAGATTTSRSRSWPWPGASRARPRWRRCGRRCARAEMASPASAPTRLIRRFPPRCAPTRPTCRRAACSTATTASTRRSSASRRRRPSSWTRSSGCSWSCAGSASNAWPRAGCDHGAGRRVRRRG